MVEVVEVEVVEVLFRSTASMRRYRCASAAALLCCALFPPVACLPTAAGGRTARHAAFASYRGEAVSDASMEVVRGAVPDWLRGAYLRNGPGLFEAGERRLRHWFDGYALLTRVQLSGGETPPRLTTRFVETDALTAARAGSLGYAEFQTPLSEPGGGVAGALRSLAALAAGDPTDNCCVNLVRHGGDLVAMTETQRSWRAIDPATLKSRGRGLLDASETPSTHSLPLPPLHQATPLRGREEATHRRAEAGRRRVPWAAGSRLGVLGTAHPHPDPAGGGGLINVATDINPPFFSSYQVYTVSAQPPWHRQLLASIPCDDRAAPRRLHWFGLASVTWLTDGSSLASQAPRWLHSFGVTDRSVVVIEQPAAYDVRRSRRPTLRLCPRRVCLTACAVKHRCQRCSASGPRATAHSTGHSRHASRRGGHTTRDAPLQQAPSTGCPSEARASTCSTGVAAPSRRNSYPPLPSPLSPPLPSPGPGRRGCCHL